MFDWVKCLVDTGWKGSLNPYLPLSRELVAMGDYFVVWDRIAMGTKKPYRIKIVFFKEKKETTKNIFMKALSLFKEKKETTQDTFIKTLRENKIYHSYEPDEVNIWEEEEKLVETTQKFLKILQDYYGNDVIRWDNNAFWCGNVYHKWEFKSFAPIDVRENWRKKQ